MKHLPRSGRPITMSTWRTPIRPAIPAEGGGTEVGSGFSDVGLSRCSWLFTYTSLSAPELSTRGLGSMLRGPVGLVFELLFAPLLRIRQFAERILLACHPSLAVCFLSFFL